jgi:hypothetical protein
MMKIKILQITVILIVLLLPQLLHAQPGFGDDVGDVPIDGGLSLLLAAGAGYGIKKMKESKSKDHAA